MSDWPYEDKPGIDTCSVFRSHVDPRVWMCNIPMTDIADGMQASTSLRKIKRYVEESAVRFFHATDGTWSLVGDELWQYTPMDYT